MKDRESVFRQTAQEIVKRWRFEESIKRPYFHIKPLEKSQIKNWKDYLDYELKQGDHKRVVFLFERCMVVCALYDFFWEKVNKSFVCFTYFYILSIFFTIQLLRKDLWK